MKNQEIKVENFENLLLELCELCSQNKQSLLGKIGMKQAKLIEMFKERDGWISVDDELPTKHDVYTVYCPSNLCFQNENEKIQIASFHPDTGWNSAILITHWQPLPKPPKG